MVRGFHRSLAEGTPFLKDRLLLVRFDPRLVQYNEAQTQQFYKLLTERVRMAPGVQGAALTQNPPLALERFDAVAFVPDGFEMPRDRENFTSTHGHRGRRVLRNHGGADCARPGLPGVRYRGCAACRGGERAVRETLLAGRRCRGQTHPAREARRRAGGDYRGRRDHQVSKRRRRSRSISCICRWPSILCREWFC